RLGVVEVLGDPVEGLEVAQAPLRFLDVRLEQVARRALEAMALFPFGEFHLDELRPGMPEEFAPEPLLELGAEVAVAPEHAVLEKRRPHRDIPGGEADA